MSTNVSKRFYSSIVFLKPNIVETILENFFFNFNDRFKNQGAFSKGIWYN